MPDALSRTALQTVLTVIQPLQQTQMLTLQLMDWVVAKWLKELHAALMFVSVYTGMSLHCSA